MEKLIRKIVEIIVLIFAYIPMGAASIAFIWSGFIFSKHVCLWVKSGVWAVPKLFETVSVDFFSCLMDERISGFRIPLIKCASMIAALPMPLLLFVLGFIFLFTGLLMLRFAKAIKEAGRV